MNWIEPLKRQAVKVQVKVYYKSNVMSGLKKCRQMLTDANVPL